MRFACPLLVVKDIGVSRAFYESLLGQTVILDFGENITFEGNFSLQSKSSWAYFIGKSEDEIKEKADNFELYFEADDFDDFLARLKKYQGLEYLHGVREYPWGQKVIRFYDPDYHIIEVGENMKNVVRRFYAQGLSVDEIASRTQHPLAFVRSCL